MTVIVQPNVDSNGNPQPMVYDSDTKKIIVDSNGYVLNGSSQVLDNVPSLLGYINTPKTQTSGIGEALQYAIGNPAQQHGGGYWLNEVQLNSGFFTISTPIVLNIPYKIMNLTLKGIDSMSPYISCAFNTTSNDTYPYAININSSDLDNISYMNIQWEHFQVQVPSGFTPYGFANFDFSSVNTGQNVFIGYDLNVSNSGFIKAFNLLGFQQIHLFDFETYGGATYLDASTCDIFGGIISGGSVYVGGVSNGNYYSSTVSVIPTGNCNFIETATQKINLGRYNVSATFTVNVIHLRSPNAEASNFNHIIYFNNSGGTIAVNTFIIDTVVTPESFTSNQNFVGQQSGGSYTIGRIFVGKVLPNTSGYTYTGIPTNATTVSGTTAGSFTANEIDPKPDYKKVIIYLDGYENDSTTAQTYTFPVAFSTVAVITNNSASVPGVSTSLTEFSIAPDTTTAYTGIIVIEGY